MRQPVRETLRPQLRRGVRNPPPARGRLLLSGGAVDDDAEAGTVVGTLSVVGAGAGPWAYSLLDDGGGMFAVAGSDIVAGLTPLDHATAPAPVITVAATNGRRTLRKSFALNVRRPLPALPLAAGAKVVGVGHSFVQRAGWGINSGGLPRDLATSIVRGVLPWIRLRDNRFNLDAWSDIGHFLGGDNYINGAYQGYGGDHIVAEGGAPGVIERLPYVIGLEPGIVYLDIGTNDISSAPGASTALVTARLDRLLALLRNEGIWAVIQTVTDRGSWAEGSEKATIVAGVNEWIKAQATRDGVRVCDLTALGFNRPAFDTTLFGGDVLHPNPKGAERMADVLLPLLQDMVAAGGHMDLTDAATYLSASNLWADSAFAATAAAGGTGASGTRVSTLSISRASGDSTAVCAVEAAGDHNRQVVTITPSGTQTGNRYEEWRIAKTAALTLSTVGIVPGTDWLESGVYVELNAWEGWLSAYWQMEFYNNANAQVFIARGGLQNADYTTQDLPLATEGFAGWLKIPPFQVPAGIDATTLRIATRPLVVNINRRVSGQGVIKISKPFLRKCADPRPAWNLAA